MSNVLLSEHSRPGSTDAPAHENGGQLLVHLLKEAGVDTVFGIISVHNLPLVEEVAKELRFVPVRHEASAVNAADGYARASGKLGCALTSTGTGAGNAAGSLIESLSSATSVLHITGQVESRYVGSGRAFIHETKDQLGMLQAVSRAAFSIGTADEAEPVLRRAIELATDAVGGPVSVEWPINLQYASVSGPGVTADLPLPATPVAPAEEELAAALEQLKKAQRPLIWAGGGAARNPENRELLTQLCELWPVGVITSNSGRGCLPEDHPRVIGNYGATPTGRALLGEADCLLTLGTHFRSNETGDYSVAMPANHVQVDQDPAAVGRVYPVSAGVTGDITAFLNYLLTHAAELGGDPDWASASTAAREKARRVQREGLGDHEEFADAIAEVFPAGSPIARDVTIASSSWGNRLLPIHRPESNIFPRGGGIGQGLGMALGAALADPDVPTLAIVGDGGLAVHFGELLTLAQENPWLVLLVFNDGGYGVLRNMQHGQDKPGSAVDLHTPEFAGLAGALGLAYSRIDDRASVRPVLADAVAARQAILVEVDLAAYGDMNQAFTPPVTVPGKE
ncbi:thiamine pyrophosphate-binding protein [Corynebacterium halotolerans]|uniref:thiamine pyrophosphate-binding protein n=1 Tax=Corynebacterium halotolerans TaxID=225326 RepID=UPI003CF16F31